MSCLHLPSECRVQGLLTWPTAFFLKYGFWVWTQVSGLHSEHFGPLSHLTGPAYYHISFLSVIHGRDAYRSACIVWAVPVASQSLLSTSQCCWTVFTTAKACKMVTQCLYPVFTEFAVVLHTVCITATIIKEVSTLKSCIWYFCIQHSYHKLIPH